MSTLIAVFGATGLGKTEVAVALAELLDTEIVSADSMQVYGGLPLLTNQPTAEQLARVRHHLVAVVPTDHDYSVAEYAHAARRAIDDVLARRDTVVLEGGSGLYLRAALGGLSFGAAPDAALRAELAEAARLDLDGTVERLRCLDPATAERIDTANPRRVVRALETVIAQGSPLSREQYERLWGHEAAGPVPADAATSGHRPVPSFAAAPRGATVRLFCLEPDRAHLREAVDARVERMYAAGLLDEVRAARARGVLSRSVRQAIGVEEALLCLDGEIEPDEAIRRTQARTRRYVRRQLTWMRKLRDADIIPAFDRSPDDVAHDIRGRLS